MRRANILHHLVSSPLAVQKLFPNHVLKHIERAIQESEKQQSGEIRFAVEAGLDLRALLVRTTPRDRALQVFSDLRIWDTEENNGVLIYLLLAERTIEIVADRGADRKVGTARWQEICRGIEQHFVAGQFERGVLDAITAITDELAKHYPPRPNDRNELPDAPVRL
ncbi:MAG: TPM domain-containing protein [Bdellovibrionota bacterium]